MSDLAVTCTECPYCGWELTPRNSRRHLNACPRNPALRVRIVLALTDAARPGYAVRPLDYTKRARRGRAPSPSLLYRAWGHWEVAAEYFGLQYERRRKGRD